MQKTPPPGVTADVRRIRITLTTSKNHSAVHGRRLCADEDISIILPGNRLQEETVDRFDELVRDLPPAEFSKLLDRATRISRLRRFGAPSLALLVGAVVAMALAMKANGLLIEYATAVGIVTAVIVLVLAGIVLKRVDKAFERDLNDAHARALGEDRKT